MVTKKKNRPAKGRSSDAKSRRSSSKKSLTKSIPASRGKAIAKRLGVEYAVARGMVGQFLKKLAVKYLTADETAMLATYTACVPSLQIIYHTVHGQVIPDFWYIRYLAEVLDKKGNLIKFTGPQGLGPYCYFARTWPSKSKPKLKSWPHIAKTPGIPIFLTEGPFKSCALARMGFAAIGLAGVWAFLKDGKLLPEFAQIEWVDRKVFVIYDNDIVHKPGVRAAMGRLVHELTNLGALPRIVYLPDFETTGEKIGVDDFLVKRKFVASALDDLDIEVCDETSMLHFLNSRVAYIRQLKAYRDLKYGIFYRGNELHAAFAPLTYWIDTVNGKREKSAVVEWKKWSRRAEYDDLDYLPGSPRVVDSILNTWPGWGVEAAKGDVRPVLRLINYLFAGSPDQATWLLQWLAYPIQNPGAKLFASVLIWSSEQGVGKSLLAEIMGDIYGKNYAEISRASLAGDFNHWAKHKQFVQGDEITGSDSRKFADSLKAMITRQRVEINEKYAPQFFLTDCTNYFFTSNHVDAIFLEDADRRYFVIEVTQPKKPDSFYERLRTWRDKPSTDNPNGKFRGASAFRWYLENEVDLEGFKPHAEAPVTESKREMIAFSKSDIDMFAREVRDNPDGVLQGANLTCERDLYEADAIHSFAKGYCDRPNVTKIAVSKALARIGITCRVINFGRLTRRLWPLRNTEAWQGRPNTEWVEAYEKFTKQKKF